jgi:pimeloyl-ACP methyl ester carboxylesterase
MVNQSLLQDSQQAHDFILFAQHGWVDSSHDMERLARSLTSPNTLIYAPDLGWVDTCLTIAPLINRVEKIAAEAIATYPDLPCRIIGHSMGGLIWLEVLNRHPEWWSRVHSLVLLGSPIGGSDLGRLVDPFGWLPLIARDLGTNRRHIAEAIASQIPTVSIVGDIGNHTDGTVPVGCSDFAQANFVCLDKVSHAALKNHPQVKFAVRDFWGNPIISSSQTSTAAQLIAKLRSLDLTETNNQNFKYAQVIQTYPDGTKLWTWTNRWQLTHVFVSKSTFNDQNDQYIYSAYTGWKGRNKLAISLKALKSVAHA